MILQEPAHSRYDLVIIGSGPAGICTAMQLAEQSSATIAIIESGQLQQNEKIQTLSEMEAQGDLEPYKYTMHAQRCFGGTCTIWGGFCAMLEERAFLTQAWPLSYNTITRYYPAAADILELPKSVYNRAEVPLKGCESIIYRPFYLSPPVRFNQKYHAYIEQHPRIHLITGKTCTRLVRQGKRVTEARLVDSLAGGEERPLRGEGFVVACGGMGNPRLLQLSGIGEQMPVGQCFMEHPHLYGIAHMYLDAGRIEPVVETEANVVHALQLTDACCMENGILSFSADFNLAKRGQAQLLGKRQILIPTPVTIRAEMPCSADNRTWLGAETNYLGQPVSHVNFEFNFQEAAHQAWQIFSQELLRSGLGRPSVLTPELRMTGGGHLMGTTRMGRTPADSVVNANCQVHGLDNLYVAGSSLFPAGGASNPTFTLVALALRLGDHLAQTYAGGTV